MKKLIYKFLDEYIGDTFVSEETESMYRFFTIISNKGVVVISFMVRNLNSDNPQIKIFRNDRLCQTVGAFFELDSEESMKVVRDWFGNKLNFKKVHDLLDFVPNEKEYVYEH